MDEERLYAEIEALQDRVFRLERQNWRGLVTSVAMIRKRLGISQNEGFQIQAHGDLNDLCLWAPCHNELVSAGIHTAEDLGNMRLADFLALRKSSSGKGVNVIREALRIQVSEEGSGKTAETPG